MNSLSCRRIVFLMTGLVLASITNRCPQVRSEYTVPLFPYYEMPFFVVPGPDEKAGAIVVLNPTSKTGFMGAHPKNDLDLLALHWSKADGAKFFFGDLLKGKVTGTRPPRSESLYDRVGVVPYAVMGRECLSQIAMVFDPRESQIKMYYGPSNDSASYARETKLNCETNLTTGEVQIAGNSYDSYVDLTCTIGICLPTEVFLELPKEQIVNLTTSISYAKAIVINGCELRSISILHGDSFGKPIIGFPVFRQSECQLDFIQNTCFWRVKTGVPSFNSIYKHDVISEMSPTGLLVKEVPEMGVLHNFLKVNDRVVGVNGLGSHSRLKCFLHEEMVKCVLNGGVIRIIRDGYEYDIDVSKDEELFTRRDKFLGTQ